MPELHAVARLFPDMSADEYAGLRDDIRQYGQHEPIVLWQEQVIDGRHRLRACEELGVQPFFRRWEGAEQQLVPYVVSLNMKRRHLDESQRAMVAARIANLLNGQRATSANLRTSAVTQPQAATLMNVGERSVQSARRVLDHGSPEVVQAVDAGRVPVSVAAQVTRLPREQQSEALREVQRRREEAPRRVVHEQQRQQVEQVARRGESASGRVVAAIINARGAVREIKREIQALGGMQHLRQIAPEVVRRCDSGSVQELLDEVTEFVNLWRGNAG